MREFSRIIVTATLIVGMAACSRISDGSAVPGQGGIASLAGTEWVLQAFGPEGEEEPAVSPAVSLAFGADGTFAGSAGCNRYFGRFVTPSGDSLTLGDAGSTMMACPGPVMTQEYQYLEALANVGRYRVTADELVLLDGSGQLLRFSSAPQDE